MTEFTIHGHQLSLSEGRKVWAGEHDESWYIQFDNGQGELRKLRISYAAAEALVKLLTLKPDEVYRYVLTVDPSGEQPMKWEAVDPLRDPVGTSDTSGASSQPSESAGSRTGGGE